MENYKIITDITADLYDNYFESNNTVRLPLPFSIAGQDFDGENNLPKMSDFYNIIRRGNPVRTSQANIFIAKERFREILANGNDLIYICFSSAMSGTYDNLYPVIEDVKKEFPERKATIIDSLSGAGGEGLLVYYAQKMQENGATYEEIVEWVENNKLNTHHIFIVNDLNNLKLSGRISAIVATIGSLIKIKPILELSREGKITNVAKTKGTKKAISKMIEITNEMFETDKNDFILIGHCDAETQAKELAIEIEKATGWNKFQYGNINYLVGGHAGADSLAIFFMGKERKKKIIPII